MKQNKQLTKSPGEVIREYLLDGLKITVGELARAIDVPTNRLYLIIQNKRDITVDTAIRLGLYLNMDPLFWLNIQNEYDIKQHLEKNPEKFKTIRALLKK